MQNEGLVSNDSVDPGGLTFMGISKVFWPSWEGWDLLEASGYKQTPSIESAVKRFYRLNFWNQILGDDIDSLSNIVAEKLFDTAVNMGVNKAVVFFQDAMNLLNVTGSLYPDIEVDGNIGSKTISTFRRYLSYDSPGKDLYIARLLKVMTILQGHFYIEQMRKYPKKEKFRGWFDRA